MGANAQARAHPPEDPTTKGQEDPKNASMVGAQQISTRAQDRVKGEKATGDKDTASLVDNKQAAINIGRKTSTKGGGPPPRDWRAGWTDICHPKIKEMMNPYFDCYSGQLFLAELLDASGKRQTDLPTLPKFTHANGRPFLCWNCTLGHCTW